MAEISGGRVRRRQPLQRWWVSSDKPVVLTPELLRRGMTALCRSGDQPKPLPTENELRAWDALFSYIRQKWERERKLPCK